MLQGIKTTLSSWKMNQTPEREFHLCPSETNLGAFCFFPSGPFCDTRRSAKYLSCSAFLPEPLDWSGESLGSHILGFSELF